jgi:hypothetical protein
MTAVVQNRTVKAAFECLIGFAQNPSRILKALPPFFHPVARIMGNVLRFIDGFMCRRLCGIGRVVDLLFRFVFHVAHDLSPFGLFNVGSYFLAGYADCRTAAFPHAH